MQQRSEEWFMARLGKVTASRVADVVAKTKTGYGASRANYHAELLVERLTGQPTQGYVNAAMQHGIDTEPEARAAYEFATGNCVQEIGFVDHHTIKMTGASPDGLIDANGMLEIKCPQPAAHIAILKSKSIPAKYYLQMQWQMACAGRDWCDFVSYLPALESAGMELFVKTVSRDSEVIEDLEQEIQKFLADLNADEAKLRAEYGQPIAA